MNCSNFIWPFLSTYLQSDKKWSGVVRRLLVWWGYLSLWTRCAVMRAPEAPRGCPMAMAPPSALLFSGSRPNTLETARYWAANASFTWERAEGIERRTGEDRAGERQSKWEGDKMRKSILSGKLHDPEYTKTEQPNICHFLHQFLFMNIKQTSIPPPDPCLGGWDLLFSGLQWWLELGLMVENDRTLRTEITWWPC